MQKYRALKKVQNTNIFQMSNFSRIWPDTSVVNKKSHKSLEMEKRVFSGLSKMHIFFFHSVKDTSFKFRATTSALIHTEIYLVFVAFKTLFIYWHF